MLSTSSTTARLHLRLRDARERAQQAQRVRGVQEAQYGASVFCSVAVGRAEEERDRHVERLGHPYQPSISGPAGTSRREARQARSATCPWPCAGRESFDRPRCHANSCFSSSISFPMSAQPPITRKRALILGCHVSTDYREFLRTRRSAMAPRFCEGRVRRDNYEPKSVFGGRITLGMLSAGLFCPAMWRARSRGWMNSSPNQG